MSTILRLSSDVESDQGAGSAFGLPMWFCSGNSQSACIVVKIDAHISHLSAEVGVRFLRDVIACTSLVDSSFCWITGFLNGVALAFLDHLLVFHAVLIKLWHQICSVVLITRCFQTTINGSQRNWSSGRDCRQSSPLFLSTRTQRLTESSVFFLVN